MTRTRFGDRRGPKVPVTAEASGQTATIRLYDRIDSWGGDWGVSAAEFTATLDTLDRRKTGTIELHLNSPGGEVYEAIAILNALREFPARVVAVVDGLAASAASFIAAGADETVMGRNTELMIHDAAGIALGNEQVMRQMAADLDRVSDNIASIYADKAGGDPKSWRKLMRAETWFTAEEAVAAGLADSVRATPDSEDTRVSNRFDLSIFAYAGRAAAPAPAVPGGVDETRRGHDTGRRRTHQAAPVALDLPAASAAGSTSPATRGDTIQEGTAVAFTAEQYTDLRRKVGVPEDADEATILAALDEALQERANDAGPTTIPAGMAVVDEATLDQLRADAALGRQAAADIAEQRRLALVNAAVQDGRIAPARRDHWLGALAADAGAADVLAALAPGLVPVAEIGAATVEAVEPSAYDAIYGKDA